MARHIKKGDTVKVITGKHKGETGEVMEVLPKKDRVIVKGINIRVKHLRRNPQNQQGGRIETEMPIHISNVMPVNSKGEATRVRFETKADGSKVRVAVKGGEELSVLKKAK